MAEREKLHPALRKLWDTLCAPLRLAGVEIFETPNCLLDAQAAIERDAHERGKREGAIAELQRYLCWMECQNYEPAAEETARALIDEGWMTVDQLKAEGADGG